MKKWMPAKVEQYDRLTATGSIRIGNQCHQFLASCFFSDPPHRLPHSGDDVEVVFRPSGDRILAVRTVRKRLLHAL